MPLATVLISPQGFATQTLPKTTIWDNSDHYNMQMMRMYMRGYATGRRNLQDIPMRYRAAAIQNKERREARIKAREEKKKQCIADAAETLASHNYNSAKVMHATNLGCGLLKRPKVIAGCLSLSVWAHDDAKNSNRIAYNKTVKSCG